MFLGRGRVGVDGSRFVTGGRDGGPQAQEEGRGGSFRMCTRREWLARLVAGVWPTLASMFRQVQDGDGVLSTEYVQY